MAAEKKRLVHLNKYQIKVLTLVLLPPVIITTVMGVLSSLFFDQLLTAVESGSMSTMLAMLSQWKINILVGLWVLLTLVILWAYVVSRNLLGAFTRLFRELDEMIAGKREVAELKARDKDDFANELLKRINILIKKP